MSALPLVFQEYAGSLPFVVDPGQPGIVASQAAAFLYGGAIVLVVLFEPGGLAGLARRFPASRSCTGCYVRSGPGTKHNRIPAPRRAESSTGGDKG